MKSVTRFISLILVFGLLCTFLASCGYHEAQGSGEKEIGDVSDLLADAYATQLDAEATYTPEEIESVVMQLDFGEDVVIENVSACYVSDEYLAEMEYNSLELYIWEVAASAFDELQNEAWFLSIENGVPTPVVLNRQELIAQNEAMMNPSVSDNKTAKNFLIGAGVILVCVAVSVVGSPAVACVALSAAKAAAIGSVVGAGVYAGVAAVSYRISEGTWKIPAEYLLDYASLGFRDGAILGAISGALNPSVCFPAGTALLSANGAVAIQDVKVGDRVWTWNEATGETVLQTVTHTMTNTTSEMMTLTFDNGEILECTPDHPFYVVDCNTWVRAAELRSGSTLVNVSGEQVVLQDAERRYLDSPVDVFNVTVDTAHSYYVLAGEESVLVHNSCAHQTSAWRTERASYWKSQGQLYRNQVNAGALSGSGNYTLSQSNISRMLSGKAPIGIDGKFVQLHHTTGISNNLTAYSEITSTQHFANYKALHPWLFK